MKKPKFTMKFQGKITSLRAKLTWQVLLIGILPIIIIGFITYSSYGQSVQSAKDGLSTAQGELSDDFVGVHLQDVLLRQLNSISW